MIPKPFLKNKDKTLERKLYFVCILRVADVDRPVISSDVLFIRDEDFARLSDETYFRVLASDKRGSEISKSYYYFIVNKLRSVGLLIDNAVGFKAVLPFSVSSGNISLGEGVMFITDNRRLVYYAEDSAHACGKCPLKPVCLSGLKSIVKEMDVKVRDEVLYDAWLSVIDDIRSQLFSSLQYMRVRAEIGKVSLREKQSEGQLTSYVGALKRRYCSSFSSSGLSR